MQFKISSWTVAAATTSLVLSVGARAENGGRGGGEAYAAHFSAAGKRVGQAYRLICALKDRHRDVCSYKAKFLAALESASVIPEVFGEERKEWDAGPDGSGNILLNFPTYRSHLARPDATAGLLQVVAHEYFIAANVEGNDSYTKASSPLVAALKSENFDFAALLGASPAIAPEVPEKPPVAPCSDVSSDSTIGTRCSTRQHIEFVRVEGGWQDTGPGGRTWFDTLSSRVNFVQASEVCRSLGQMLPSNIDIQTALNHGAESIIWYFNPNKLLRGYLWSSTPVVPDKSPGTVGPLGCFEDCAAIYSLVAHRFSKRDRERDESYSTIGGKAVCIR